MTRAAGSREVGGQTPCHLEVDGSYNIERYPTGASCTIGKRSPFHPAALQTTDAVEHPVSSVWLNTKFTVTATRACILSGHFQDAWIHCQICRKVGEMKAARASQASKTSDRGNMCACGPKIALVKKVRVDGNWLRIFNACCSENGRGVCGKRTKSFWKLSVMFHSNNGGLLWLTRHYVSVESAEVIISLLLTNLGHLGHLPLLAC